MYTSQERLAALERQVQRVQRRLDKITVQNNTNKMLVLVLFVAGIIISCVSLLVAHLFGILVAIAVGISLIVVVGKDRKLPQSYLHHQAWLRFLKQQIARISLNWDALPPLPDLPEDEPDHPFDIDLDISGQRSLHRLLNTGVSYEGIMTLRDWLLNRDLDAEEIQQRQAFVRELIPLMRFRDKFQIYSLFATRFFPESVDGERLLNWLDANAETRQSLSSLLVAVVLALLFYASLIFFFVYQSMPFLCVITFVLCAAWFQIKRKEQGNLTDDIRYQRTAFEQLQIIFNYLEKYPYAKGSRLQEHCAVFSDKHEHRPSVLLPKFDAIAARASLARSPEFWFVLNALVPIGAYTAYRFDQCKEELAAALPLWLEAWYELEALCSLANFAYLNPDFTFPEIVTDKESGHEKVFVASNLGHPLLAREHRVTNDFALERPDEVLLITGSNMAGKSTFLRTLGVNMVLAYAGSVVDATSLRVSLFEVYACIRVTDSIADGYSYFYAEVRRLKGLLSELEEGMPHPVFFLIDEIFKGTNNYERLIGSEAYIRALLAYECVGAISTHDLELVKLSTAFDQIKNYHFREDIVDGRMVFDYILHPGPSPTRNALRIMQMEGLPVRWENAPALES